MTALSFQRCFNHASREAVARCPECGRFYCRECVTEHDDRVMCAACLKRLADGVEGRQSFSRWVGVACAALGGLLLAGLFFQLAASLLVSLPARFHEGTLWAPDRAEENGR